MAKEPIDRQGTRNTNTTDIGKVMWDPDVSIPRAASCFASLCDDLEMDQRNDVLKLAGPAPELVTLTCVYHRSCVTGSKRTVHRAHGKT